MENLTELERAILGLLGELSEEGRQQALRLLDLFRSLREGDRRHVLHVVEGLRQLMRSGAGYCNQIEKKQHNEHI